MWKLFRANSYTVVRLLINQIALSLFSLMMVSVYTIFEHWSVQLIVGIFCAGFYLYLQYTVLWADGAKDRVRYDVDRAEYIKGKGFFLALKHTVPAAFSFCKRGFVVLVQLLPDGAIQFLQREKLPVTQGSNDPG